MFVALYRAKDGPRIIFRLQSAEEREKLRALFLDLANRRIDEFSLRDATWVEFAATCPTIALQYRPDETSRQIQYKGKDDIGKILTWTRHEEGWMECVEKIEALSGPGHQFMGSGEAEVEVSFLVP
jgi:hypothetical protein